MFFRRILALVALFPLTLLLVASCTPDGSLPQTAAPARPASAADADLPREIEREVGPIYPSPPLHALVERVGQKLVAASGLPGPFHFYVLDEPVPNAHAVSSGYVFVTRGLLAMIDDDAELAAAIGHELGHVELKHGAQREKIRRSVMEAAVDAALTSGSATVGRSVAREGMLKLRRYSRDQELEADKAGVGYLVRAGFRADAMISLIEKLQRELKLEDKIIGIEADTERSAFATHPDPDQRLAALRSLPEAHTPGAADRPGYLALIDGLSIDDSPEEGFVRGSAFLHPIMRIAFQMPADFQLFNDHDGVLGVGRDRSMVYFSCTDQKVEGRLDAWMRDKLQPTPTDIQETEIGGAEAAIGAKPRGSDTGLGQVRYVLIRRPDGLCYFSLLSEGADRDKRIEAMVAATRSFRTLSDAEVAALRPYRLGIVSSAGQTANGLAARMPYPTYKMEHLLTLNGVDDAAALMKLPSIKLVVP